MKIRITETLNLTDEEVTAMVQRAERTGHSYDGENRPRKLVVYQFEFSGCSESRSIIASRSS